MWKGTDTVGKYVSFVVELNKFAFFCRNHHHISLLIMKSCLLLFYGKPSGAFLSFFDGEDTTGIVIKIHALRTLSSSLVFFVSLLVDSIQLKVFFRIYSYCTDDALLDVFKLVKFNLLSYCLVPLSELLKEFAEQVQSLVYFVI